MRKAQKQQAQELVQQMEEAHDQIKKYIEQDNIQPAMELLEDCQHGGITLGNLIEGTEGDGHPTVALLEEYCELIYRIHEELADSNDKEMNANKIYKLLKQKLIKVENSLRNGIAIRREAVFLPYKASMWDSLESVWKAADEDPNCDAYVIPIPYYDKNPDGSFREMHYEGDQYPDYVSITRYDEFDFGVHHPDMIFIHNPYDDTNLVTSVHPFFYSDKLKKHTDELIYIPYFILSEISPEDDAAIEHMKHFCTVPGVYNADRIIVQSEDMKQIYIKVLLDVTNNHTEMARKYWDDRILGLGSPKIDRVLNTKKEDLEIPQEWLRIIQKPDGSWKKIILYNTSIGALLQHNEKMLEKMEDVFRIFKENQDEVALLWRPHPLIRATVESMRPQLWIEYDRIVRKYREENWGIYDDSADVDRAVVVSDAYYGDGSSVVELYRKTGKGILVQSMILRSSNALGFEAFAVVDEFTAYASCMQFNGLFRVDRKTGRCSYVAMFPQEHANKARLHVKAVYANKKIYFVPASAEHISIYYIDSGKFDTVSIKDNGGRYDFYSSSYKFADAVEYEGNLFLIGSTYPAILKISTITGKIDYYTDWISEEGFYFRKGTVVCGSVFYIPNAKGNGVLEFHMDSCIGKWHHIGTQNNGSWSMCKVENCFWLIPKQEGPIIKWNPANGRVAEYCNYPEGFEGHGFLFTKGYYYNGYIMTIPAFANMSVKISQATGEISKNKVIENEQDTATGFLFEEEDYYYLGKKKIDNSAASDMEYFRLNIHNNVLEEYHFDFWGGKEKYVDDYYKCLMQLEMEEKLQKEHGYFALIDFLKKAHLRSDVEEAVLPDNFQRNAAFNGPEVYKRICGEGSK